LVGNYTESGWALSDDGKGGTLLVDPPAATPHIGGELSDIQDGSAHVGLSPSQVVPIASPGPSELHQYIAEFSSQEGNFVFADEMMQPKLSADFKAPISSSAPEPNNFDLQQLDNFNFQLLIPTEHDKIDKSHGTDSTLDHDLQSHSLVTQHFVQIFSTNAQDQLFYTISGTGGEELSHSPLFHQPHHFVLHP
jgi:hypothetical protein